MIDKGYYRHRAMFKLNHSDNIIVTIALIVIMEITIIPTIIVIIYYINLNVIFIIYKIMDAKKIKYCFENCTDEDFLLVYRLEAWGRSNEMVEIQRGSICPFCSYPVILSNENEEEYRKSFLSLLVCVNGCFKFLVSDLTYKRYAESILSFYVDAVKSHNKRHRRFIELVDLKGSFEFICNKCNKKKIIEIK